MKILIIIPCFNEGSDIKSTVEAVVKNFPSSDILVVNDGSTDDSLSIIKVMKVPFLDLAVNIGIGGAMQAGFEYAKKHDYDIAVQCDGDGQHPPYQIKKLVDELTKNGTDIIIGSRFTGKQNIGFTAARKTGIIFFSHLVYALTGKRIYDTTSGFRACSKRAISAFVEYYPQDYPEPESLIILLKNNFSVKEIPVLMKTRKGGASSISLTRSIYYMLKVSLAILIQSISPVNNHHKEGARYA